MLKQQLENQIELLKEQIHSARMNDAHYDQRARAIDSEIDIREKQLKELEAEQDAIHAQLEEKTKQKEQAKAELIEVQTRIATITASVEKNKGDIIDLMNSRA